MEICLEKLLRAIHKKVKDIYTYCPGALSILILLEKTSHALAEKNTRFDCCTMSNIEKLKTTICPWINKLWHMHEL